MPRQATHHPPACAARWPLTGPLSKIRAVLTAKEIVNCAPGGHSTILRQNALRSQCTSWSTHEGAHVQHAQIWLCERASLRLRCRFGFASMGKDIHSLRPTTHCQHTSPCPSRCRPGGFPSANQIGERWCDLHSYLRLGSCYRRRKRSTFP